LGLLFDLAFQLLFEIVGQVILECVVSFAWSTLSRPVPKERATVLTSIGVFGAGLSTRALSAMVFPRRLLPPSPLPGASLLLSPIGAGLAVQWIGDRLRARGRRPILLSFWPGAAFALGVAIVRFVYPLWFR